MAPPKPPPGFVLDVPDGIPPPPPGFALDGVSQAIPQGSPLEKAMKEQSGEIVTVETPTGPAQFTRDGQRFFSGDELAQMDAGPKARESALSGALSFLSGGGPLIDEFKGIEAALNVNDPR